MLRVVDREQRLDMQSAGIGRIAHATERHGETSLGLPIAPLIGKRSQTGQLIGRSLRLLTDSQGVAEPREFGDGALDFGKVSEAEVAGE